MDKFSLDDKIELKGYWYLPSNPENTVAGIATYYPNEKIVLELMGDFENSQSLAELFKNDKEETVIYGKTSDAKEVTLLQSFRSFQLHSDAEFPIIRYTSMYMIIGKHIKSLDEKCQYYAIAEIPELSFWCQPNALKTVFLYDKKGNSKQISLSFSPIFRNKADIIDSTKINENTIFKIRQRIFYNGDNMNPEIGQYSCLEICKKNKTTINEILFNLFMYEQFLSLATLSIVKCSKITLYDRKIFQQIENTKFYREIYVIHPFIERKNLQDVTSKFHKFLFYYSTIKNDYPIIIQKWFNESAELAPIRSHLIKSLEKKRVYSSIDFLIIIQAIEGFYRRFRNRKYRKANNLQGKASGDLYSILEDLIDEFSDIDWLKKYKIDIDAVVDSRRYFSHFMPKQPSLKPLDGLELLEQTKKIRILLLCCVLSHIGFENKQINSILNQSYSDIIQK